MQAQPGALEMLVDTAQLSTWLVVGPQGRIQRTNASKTSPGL